MNDKVKENINEIVAKVRVIDGMMQSLVLTHEDDKDKREELLKRYSGRKLILVEEVYGLLSNLTII